MVAMVTDGCYGSCTNERSWVRPRNEHKPRRHVSVTSSEHFAAAVDARRRLHQDGDAGTQLVIIHASTFYSTSFQSAKKDGGAVFCGFTIVKVKVNVDLYSASS